MRSRLASVVPGTVVLALLMPLVLLVALGAALYSVGQFIGHALYTLYTEDNT